VIVFFGVFLCHHGVMLGMITSPILCHRGVMLGMITSPILLCFLLILPIKCRSLGREILHLPMRVVTTTVQKTKKKYVQVLD
jgi:hypothetical protein